MIFENKIERIERIYDIYICLNENSGQNSSL
jgi:hypothetical protein